MFNELKGDYKKEYIGDFSEEKNDKISVMIAIPNTGWIIGGLETRIARWIMEKDFNVKQIFARNKPTYSNRNIIAKEFLESDCDFLLTIDSDTVPTKNPLDLVEHDLDIVGGVYPTWKNDDYIWLACWEKEDGSYVQYKKAGKGLQEVDALGTGCLCVKREVLEKMPMPFIDKVREGTGDRELGHDLYFCKRAREMGYKVWADWDLICEHTKELPIIPIINAINKSYEAGFNAGKKQRG